MTSSILNIINILLLLSAAVFTVCPYFTSSLLVSKWYFTATVLVVGLLLWGCYCLNARKTCCSPAYTVFENSVTAVCTVESLFLILQECHLMPKFGVLSTGTFDNVAGFASCVSLSWPFGLLCWRGKRKKEKAAIVAVKLICLLAIAMSGSRTALLCVALSTIFLLDVGKTKKMAMLSVFVLVAVGFVCLIKTDSSKGRYFIGARSMEMVQQHPLMGWGMDGFRKNYMAVQADYFKSHPESEYAMLADGIRHPLNEYLRILVDFGVVGLMAFGSLVELVIAYYVRHRGQQAKIGMIVFAEILLLAVFSYPSYYPFTWVMLTYSLSRIFNVYVVSKTLLVIAVVMCIGCALPLAISMKNEMEWGRLSLRETYGLSRKALSKYGELYGRMKGNAYFLYNYAFELYCADRLDDALRIAKECRNKIGHDYDTELLLGDIHRQRGEHSLALGHYYQAHFMIPSRFVPLYCMYRTFDASGDTIRRNCVAEEIMHKAVKVESEVVKTIKNRIKEGMK